ncbi:DUF7619 domain-containing protein [Flavobacterium selenitireducens]|uniref:DUF7619 domain-containing protein n=1 Tax=Flavobacterium selenitireducens TaxID=2722704 RepID=UPI00168A6793|nr:T9SS type A sorting domain-containing protein [Flavobacterium selenitireducens]MBD3583486.1 T9SS type A sorting domain-containing protein [Flavobacterium selenitireducens]
MKKLYFLLLFCGGLAYAQPDINQNPTPLSVCDSDGDGLGTFNLASAVPEVLGSLDASQHTVTVHFSDSDAQQGLYPISDLSTFNTTVPNAQVLYFRVEENADPDSFAIAALQLFVHMVPTATVSALQPNVCVGESLSIQFSAAGGTAPYTFTYQINGGLSQTLVSNTASASLNLSSEEPVTYNIELLGVASANSCSSEAGASITASVVSPAFAFPVSPIVIGEAPNDGVAIFNLTSKEVGILNGQTNVTVSYFLSESEAQNNNNPLAAPTTYENVANPQTIWARVSAGSSSCFGITSFDLVVTDPGIVYIPDPNFKTGLIGLGYDLNSDAEIQISEAAAVTTMTVDNLSISDLTGIKSFSNLQNLYVMDNLLTNVDLSGMANLRMAYLGGNDITAINLLGVDDLRDLVLDQNQLEILVIQDKPNLDRFSAVFNNISGLFLDNLPMLREVKVIGNDLVHLDFNAFPMLQIVECSVNQLSSLEVSGVATLKTLDCSSNNLSTIDVAGLSNLENLNFNDNPIQSHYWTGLLSLKNLQFRNTGISEMDLPASPSLQTLNCQSNGMTVLDVSIYPSLTSLNCRQNQLQTLDVNANFSLQLLAISGNGMQTLFAKNGVNEQFQAVDFTTNNFSYICVDETQVASVQALAGSGVEVNSLCTIVPGGVYNTIQGNVTFDMEGDGCDASDAARPFLKMRMVSGAEDVDVFTNDQAFYDFYVTNGDYSLYPVLENNYFNIVPSSAVVSFGTVDGSVSTHDFCVSAASPSADAEVAIIPVIPARPGENATYTIVLRNKGNQPLSQSAGLQFQYDGTLMELVSASMAPAYTGAGLIVWDYADLRPFESRSITVTFNINSQFESPAVNPDDELVFSAAVEALGDVVPSDNMFSFSQNVVSAFDPNYKTCLQGESAPVSMIGEYLYYAINFENTGSATAQDIIIRDVLDPAMFDRSTLQILSSSHPVTARSSSQGIVLVFETINMDSGGHGNILLKVRTRGNLQEGSTVANKANIYLNYTSSIETGTAYTTFEALSVGQPSEGVSVNLYPNPVSDAFVVRADADIISLQLLDVQGRLLQVKMVDAKESLFDVSNRQTGVYFVKVTTTKGVRVEKIIKR